MTLGTGNTFFDFQCDDVIIENKQEELILGILIDNELSFQSHVNSICKRANQKLNALFRTTNSFSSFIKSHFNYCPLTWMFFNRTSMNKINKIQERTLRLTLNNYSDNFNDLLLISDEMSTHQRCINLLLVEVYKFLNGFSS